MATIFNFYHKFNLRCFKIFDIIFSHLVISPSAPSFNRWETSFLWSWCSFFRVKYPFWMSIEMMLMYALLESYNTGSVDITAICVNNQIESSQITWSATQQGNSKNVERQHLFRGNICAGGLSKPTAPLFCVDSCKHCHWLVVTFDPFWISCHFLDHGSQFLHTAFLVTNFFFQIQPPSLTQTYENHDKAITKGPCPMAAKGMGNASPSFISAFPKLADPKQGPWLAWCARESVVALALSWDIGQQGYAAHLVGGNGSYRREKAGK